MSRNKPYDIQNVIFHYNPYVTKWFCVPREEYINYIQKKFSTKHKSITLTENNYKKNFQMKKTDNFKIKKINNCNLVNKTSNHNLIQKIKDENELNTILDDALKEILD